jgi:hypothetical protein
MALARATLAVLRLEEEATRLVESIRPGLPHTHAREHIRRGWSRADEVSLLREMGVQDLAGGVEGAMAELKDASQRYLLAVSDTDDLSLVVLNEAQQKAEEAAPHVQELRRRVEALPTDDDA